jgi:hypothetical protein
MLTVRVCSAGEPGGVVASTYRFTRIAAIWVAVPLNVFLFGTESAPPTPRFRKPSIREALSAHVAARELCRSSVLSMPITYPMERAPVIERPPQERPRFMKSTREQDAQAVAVLTDVQHRASRYFLQQLQRFRPADSEHVFSGCCAPRRVERFHDHDSWRSPERHRLRGASRSRVQVTRYRQTEGLTEEASRIAISPKKILHRKSIGGFPLISPRTRRAWRLLLATSRFASRTARRRTRRGER